MTIIEAQSLLLNFFLENQAFGPREDFDSVISKESITRELDKAIVIAALDLLAEKEVVLPVDLESKGKPDAVVWVLIKPLSMKSQTIELSFPVATAVVNTLNDFSAAQGSDAVIDLFGLDEGAIAALVSIIHHLANPPENNGKSQ